MIKNIDEISNLINISKTVIYQIIESKKTNINIYEKFYT